MTAPSEQRDELDVGPLTEVQRRSLTRDCISQLRAYAEELRDKHSARYEVWLIDRIEDQLCLEGS